MNIQIEGFRQYAALLLENHKEELSVKYNNEPPGPELMQNAYMAHSKILLKELDNKIKEVVNADNAWIRHELEIIKEQFLHELDLTKQEN